VRRRISVLIALPNRRLVCSTADKLEHGGSARVRVN
jgi:hypothetical protein